MKVRVRLAAAINFAPWQTSLSCALSATWNTLFCKRKFYSVKKEPIDCVQIDGSSLKLRMTCVMRGANLRKNSILASKQTNR